MLCWVASGRKRWICPSGFSIGCPEVERRTGGWTEMRKWWPYRAMRYDSTLAMMKVTRGIRFRSIIDLVKGRARA